MQTILLKKGRERSLELKHPWVFSGALLQPGEIPDIKPGEPVVIANFKGHPLAIVAYSPKSQIRCRVWTYHLRQKLNTEFFNQLIEKAYQKRAKYHSFTTSTSGFRLVNGENDGVPGLIADYFNGFVSLQINSAGAEYFKTQIVEAIRQVVKPVGIYNRSDTSARTKEGLPEEKGVLWGEVPPETLEIIENGYKLLVSITTGHKTGFYLDQATNRQAVLLASRGKKVLNCFSYTGGFTVSALKGGATDVTELEASAEALELSLKNMALNNIPDTSVTQIKGDAFTLLRKMVDEGQKYDLIIMDPPKFIDAKAQIISGCRGYKDVNMLAFKLLNPGGSLFTFSCSGLLSRDLFQKIIFDAALDAGVTANIQEYLSQSSCHPVALNFPEGLYLKGLHCRVD